MMELLATKQVLPPNLDQRLGFCSYYFAKKHRFCRMQVKKSRDPVTGKITFSTFCSYHSNDPDRITCPLDSTHTVRKSDLESHLLKCPSRKKSELYEQSYYKKDINVGHTEETSISIPNELNTTIPLSERVMAAAKRLNCLNFSVSDITDKSLEDKLQQNFCGSIKHVPQIVSIVSHIERFCVPKEQSGLPCFVEFGAGKAKLSQGLALLRKGNFILLDRTHFHHTADKYVRTALSESSSSANDQTLSSAKRISIDIADFDLSGLKTANETNVIVGFGKHVCGSAADMAIRCVDNYFDQRIQKNSSDSFAVSLCFALCCYHASSWASYVGKDFLRKELGIHTEEEFKAFIKMPSWYVCNLDGLKNKRKDKNESEDATLTKRIKLEDESKKFEQKSSSEISQSEPNAPAESPKEKKYITEDSSDPRAAIGIAAHSLLSFGRLSFLRENGYTAQLVRFIDVSHTLENTLLFATKTNIESIPEKKEGETVEK